MNEKKFFLKYSVIELKRNGLFEYYLSKQDFGDLIYMYSTKDKCFPNPATVLKYIQTANATKFWKS